MKTSSSMFIKLLWLAWTLLCSIASSQSKYDQINSLLSKIPSNEHNLNPSHIQSIQSLAILYTQVNSFNEAGHYFKILGDLLKSSEAYYNAGLAYYQGNNYHQASIIWDLCSKSPYKYRPCVIKLASIYRDMENHIETQRLLLLAIKLDPKQPDAYSYLADTYNNLKQFSLAIEYYQKALAISPDMRLMMSLGDTYMNIKQYENATEIFHTVLTRISQLPASELQKIRLTGYYQALIGNFFSSIELGRWNSYELYENRILQLLKEYNTLYMEQYMAKYRQLYGTKDPNNVNSSMRPPMPPNALSPYRLLFFQADPKDQYLVSNQWSSNLWMDKTELATQSSLTERLLEGPIRIGYISRRFHNYPGTQMMIRSFGCHDRKRVYVAAIADGPDDRSLYRQFISNTSDIMLDISNLSFSKGLEQIQDASLDILVDYGKSHRHPDQPRCSGTYYDYHTAL